MGEYKIVTLDGGGVGKSALTIRLVTDNFLDEYDPTIEDSCHKNVTHNGESYILEILDTAGQEEFSSMQDEWMREGKGFILVYNITSRQSFDEIAMLRDKILRAKDEERVPIVVAGNKCDLDDQRQVSKLEGRDYCREIGVPFFETSAKDKINNEIIFYEVVDECNRFEREANEAAKPRRKSMWERNQEKRKAEKARKQQEKEKKKQEKWNQQQKIGELRDAGVTIELSSLKKEVQKINILAISNTNDRVSKMCSKYTNGYFVNDSKDGKQAGYFRKIIDTNEIEPKQVESRNKDSVDNDVLGFKSQLDIKLSMLHCDAIMAIDLVTGNGNGKKDKDAKNTIELIRKADAFVFEIHVLDGKSLENIDSAIAIIRHAVNLRYNYRKPIYLFATFDASNPRNDDNYVEIFEWQIANLTNKLGIPYSLVIMENGNDDHDNGDVSSVFSGFNGVIASVRGYTRFDSFTKIKNLYKHRY